MAQRIRRCRRGPVFRVIGFLIAGILYDSKPLYENRRREYFVNFYARRLLRIFPLYYAVLVFSLYVLPAIPRILEPHCSPATLQLVSEKLARFGSVADWGPYFWLFLSNIPIAYTADGIHGILGVTWSLAIEEQFYILWPFAVAALDGVKIRRLAIMLVGVALAVQVLAVAVFSASTADAPLPFLNPIGVYVLTPGRLDALVCGSVLAIAVRTAEHTTGAFCESHALLAAPLAMLAAFVCIDAGIGPAATRYGVAFGPLYQSIGYSLVAFVCTCKLVRSILAQPQTAWVALLESTWLCTCGKFSYAMYLFRLAIRAMVRDLVFSPARYSAAYSGVQESSLPLLAFFTCFDSQWAAQVLFYIRTLTLTLIAA